MPRPSFHALLAFLARQREIDRLQAMSDRLLAEIGLRRDQLDLQRMTAEKAPRERRRRGSFAVRPSLQGCG